MVYNTTINNNNENNKLDESNKSVYKGLNPYFITGYVDGEGSFSVRLRKSGESRWGYKILPVFSIGGQINPYNRELLEKVKEFFGGIGWISTSGNMYIYRNKKFLSKNSINSGLVSGARYYSSVSNIPAILSSDKNPSNSNFNPDWVIGFTDGEGSFIVTISKNSKYSKTGWIITPSFQLGLHKKDISILENLKQFFGVGILNIRPNNDMCFYSVTKNKDLLNVIIPHFDKYPLLSKKNADFLLFKSVVELCSKK